MPKASSPVRLQEDLMQAATLAGARLHRSAAEQVEYWASLGRSISGMINPDKLLLITAGLARIKIEPVTAPAINPEDVFAALEADRETGALTSSVSSSTVRYQASQSHPGLLEQIAANGTRTLGQFNDGVFTACEEVSQ